jgi:pyruvate,water dikinase
VVAGAREMSRIQPGDVIVSDMTDPDWEPVMKRAAAIVTNRGGRTCHAAIIARELGIPAVVGCGDATRIRMVPVTVSCAEGDVARTRACLTSSSSGSNRRCRLPVKLMMNVGNPDRAFTSRISAPRRRPGPPRVHHQPHDRRAPGDARVRAPAASSEDPAADGAHTTRRFVGRLAEASADRRGTARPVIVRLSDFKSNEYANLIGGKQYEPHEENPMLGFRGASRYVDEAFRPCFELECRALKYVRDDMGLTNVQVMVPFVRTVEEGRRVVELLAANGLARGDDGLKVIMMCELPTNALLADQYLDHFDGMSIGSNDLTQLTLGLDRDSAVVAAAFDERDAAVKALMAMAISACRRRGKYIGICGQGPSDHPDLARWLVEQGIDSVSLNPDTVVETWMFLAGAKVKAD